MNTNNKKTSNMNTTNKKQTQSESQGSQAVSLPTDMLAEKYMVFKVWNESGRKKIIEKNLTRDQAVRIVQAFPDSDKTMVCFTKQ